MRGQLKWVLLSALVVLLDLISKQEMVDSLSVLGSYPVFHGLSFTLVYNRGAACIDYFKSTLV